VLSVIGSVLGLPLLAVVGLITLCSKSTSLTLSLHNSTGLNPVSMLIDSFIDSVFPASAISIESFSLVGSVMFLASWMYSGICHWIL